MKKIVFAIIAIVGLTILGSCNDYETYGDKKDKERDETERKAWRAGVDQKLKDQDGKIDAVMLGQTTQMRADITHKIHRYMDDLGCASTEEKNSLNAEYKVYCEICKKYGIENDFVAHMMEQVMELPSRPQK